jgi:thiol-disulfide isomerase/thioredoxin
MHHPRPPLPPKTGTATRPSRRSLLAGAASLLLSGLLPMPQASAAAVRFSEWRGGATPPLQLKDGQGRDYDLAGFRGKVVLVNFWATWCEPCRDEMPSLEELQERLKGRPFAVLTVNMEESDAKVMRFLQSALLQKDSLTVLYDRFGTVAKAWKARLLPVSFLVGPDGRIHSTLLGAADWTAPEVIAQIEKLMPQGAKGPRPAP